MLVEQQESREYIGRALEYARKNLGNSGVSVEDVAREAGFSTNYFNRIFMAHTGFSVMEYIRFERLRGAAQELRSSKRDILEIALAHGYDSHEGFSRSFRAQYQCTPSEYREAKRHQAVSWGELVDETLVHRFLAKYPQFRQLDKDEVIDGLLAKDGRRFGYLCTSIQGMGLKAVTDREDWQEGFVLIGDRRNQENDWYLVLVTDEETVLREWIAQLEQVQQILTSAVQALPESAEEYREYMYFGEEMQTKLPEQLQIRRLTPEDTELIQQWAGERNDGYVRHLLHLECCMDDPGVMEFGVFEKLTAGNENKCSISGGRNVSDAESGERMIAAVGCGIESIHGFSLNDGIQIRFAAGEGSDSLYRQIYAGVTNEIVRMGGLPFDNIQYGGYAAAHGGFTSEELGYQLVNCMWFVKGE